MNKMEAKKSIITSDDILGKDAVDSDGTVLGVVIKLHIDKEFKRMTGITIDEGFMKPNLFIGMNYIKNFGVDSVFINKNPIEKYVGLRVLDSGGDLIGTVKSVNSKRHRLKSIEISKGLGGKVVILSSDIQEIGESVILKPDYKTGKVE
jgi:sporulation protein YlmC with PRC-barrel domain